MVLAAGVVFGLLQIPRLVRNSVAHFQNVKLTRLTNSGNAIDAIISPDGKYIVYALSDRSKQSLWIRQVSTANDKEIVPPAPVGFFGLSFREMGTNSITQSKLISIPVRCIEFRSLGGTPVKVLEKIDGPSVSRLTANALSWCAATTNSQGESALVIANVDGSNERTLAVRKLPEKFSAHLLYRPFVVVRRRVDCLDR